MSFLHHPRTHETPSPTLETRLSSLDFKVQHIFEKVDVINEKLHDITKTVYALSSSSANNRGRRNDRLESAAAAEQAAILTKIGHLQKQINRIESNGNGCQSKANGQQQQQQQGNGRTGASAKFRKDTSDSDEEMDDFLDKLTTKKLREMVSNRKQCRSLDVLTSLVRSVEDRTVRIYDLEANQFEQILSCCQRTNNEVTTFTNSADILLKRIEHLVLDVDRKVEKLINNIIPLRVRFFPSLLLQGYNHATNTCPLPSPLGNKGIERTITSHAHTRTLSFSLTLIHAHENVREEKREASSTCP